MLLLLLVLLLSAVVCYWQNRNNGNEQWLGTVAMNSTTASEEQYKPPRLPLTRREQYKETYSQSNQGVSRRNKPRSNRGDDKVLIVSISVGSRDVIQIWVDSSFKTSNRGDGTRKMSSIFVEHSRTSDAPVLRGVMGVHAQHSRQNGSTSVDLPIGVGCGVCL